MGNEGLVTGRLRSGGSILGKAQLILGNTISIQFHETLAGNHLSAGLEQRDDTLAWVEHKKETLHRNRGGCASQSILIFLWSNTPHFVRTGVLY